MLFQKLSLVFVCGWLSALPALTSQPATRPLSTAQAKAHVGEWVKVCGVVVSVGQARRSRGAPTFLNFADDFSAIIWQWQRHRFGDLKSKIGKEACVTGQLRDYRGKPQMTLTLEKQLTYF